MAPGGAFKDVLLAVGIVSAVLGGLFLYTGVWPPMVVVESGSMMHVVCTAPGVPDVCDPGVGYGKLGYIDPGDMVFVKHAAKREDVATLAEGTAKDPNAKNYGKPGDVVVYFNFERTRGDKAAMDEAKKRQTPIIHRAVAYVDARGVTSEADCLARGGPDASATYRVFWEGREYDFRAGDGGIVLPSLGFDQSNAYKPCWSGFITKGDNPVTNTQPDQRLGGGTLPRQPVELSWIEGKAVGELPWFGLIKLALSGDVNYNCSTFGGGFGGRANDPACENGKAVRVLNAYAPTDLWVMLGVSLAVIAIAPLGYDMYVLRRNKERAAMEARGEDPGPTLKDQIVAKLKGLRKGRDGEQGTADPARAFEPPPAAPPASPPPPPPPPPSGGGPTTKFERVRK
ncbi:MAG TPA: hypothetical protein VGR28_15580 [Candidatus Thermoplasmatota archaeon]|jgi:signal peptidase I|nr:hypothetical protein [Candidatus Thermoplasmatota archaeon]